MRQPVETQLRNYFEQIEETHGPLSTNAILERAAPVQVVPNSRPEEPSNRAFRRWAWAVALIVFAGVAIILGAIGSDAPPVVDLPVTTTVPGTLPTTPPASTESGTLETPLGVAEWWMVSGADGALPDNSGWVFETPTGYEMVVGPFGGGIEYWVSPDGRTWEPAPLPEGLSGLEAATRVDRMQVGATNWLVSDNTTQVWRLEGETWTSVPLPAGLGAFELRGVGDDQVWLTSTSPLGIWRLDGENWTSFDPGIGPDDVGPAGFISGRAVGGNEVVVIPWAADTLTVIDSGDVATAVTPPWAAQIGQANGAQPDELTVLARDGGLVAVVVDWMPGTECPPTRPECDTPPDSNVIRTWTSSDGIEWSGPIEPGFLPDDDGDFGHYAQFETVGDVVFAYVVDGASGSGQLWISEGGLEWAPSELPLIGSLSFDRVGSGWIYFDFSSGPEMFASADLREWERVDAPASAVDGNVGGTVGWASTGNAFYVFQKPDGEPGHMWMIDFAD